ncbi:MAG: arylsulfatase [Bacteroidota bacterium]
MKSHFLSLSIIYIICVITACTQKEETQHKDKESSLPNIVLILADDLGYGDVSAYNPASKIKTPFIDKLASEGMRFTDAHTPSSVCTPTRYGILTGRYCWRSRLPVGVLWGFGRTFIDTSRTTLGTLLKDTGYNTGVVGKWHLGLDWVVKENFKDSLNSSSADINELGIVRDTNPEWLDFTKPPTVGANDYGFDYSFILPASLDIPPYCFLENNTLLGGLNSYTEGNDLDKGYAEAFWRPGIMSEGFSFEGVMPKFTEKAVDFISTNAKKDAPFFLYFPLNAPHTPWVATEKFKNSSQAGNYGDFVQQVDATVGQISKTLEENGISENTIIIFTSDNGPYWRPNYIEKYQHRAAGIHKGMKADIWEGGHRVPFIVKWAKDINPNTENQQPITQTALLATIAEITGVNLGNGEGEDSESLLPMLLEQEVKERKPIIHHSSKGVFAIRSGKWKLIEGLGSGGFSEPVTLQPEEGEPSGQLYDMANDPEEKNNVYLQETDIVQRLTAELEAIKRKGVR